MTKIVYEELRLCVVKYMNEMLRQYKLRNEQNCCYIFFGLCGPTSYEKIIFDEIKIIAEKLPEAKEQKNTYSSANISDSDLQRYIDVLDATIDLINCDSIKIYGKSYGGVGFVKSLNTSYGDAFYKIFDQSTALQITLKFSENMQNENFSPKQYYLKLFKNELKDMQQKQKLYQQKSI
ncbi:MAG: hypothetical protein PVG30_04880 [Gammaproteobacteria bacterium]|jgi:hypothetical protein